MKVLMVLTSLLLINFARTVDAEVIHQQRSLYRTIIVEESGDRRCLAFTVKRIDRNQSCMSLTDPKRLVFPYVRMLLGALLLNPSPQRVLMLGLGAGTIATTLNQLYPKADIKVVEIDKAVVMVARQYFDLKTSKNLSVDVMDARVYVKRLLKKSEKFDLILLDAFTGEYIPEHLMTMEFLEEVKSLLTPTGVIAANTFSTSRLYDHESVTYTRVFGRFFNLRLPDSSNRVIISSRKIVDLGELPSHSSLVRQATLLKSSLKPYGIKIRDYPKYMQRTPDWKTDVRVLTDQYSPANLLR